MLKDGILKVALALLSDFPGVEEGQVSRNRPFNIC